MANRPSTKKRLPFILAVLCTILACLFLTSCEKTERETGEPAVKDKTLREVRIGGAPAFELILPTLVAMNKGYFQENSLEISEFIQGPGSDMRTALLSGDIDLGLLAFVHVPLARIKGQNVKIVSTIYEREIFSLIVRKNLENEVKTVADLKGKKIGIAKPGSGNWALASSYLSQSGLDPEKDVDFITVGNNLQTVYNAIKTDRIDAYPSFEPQTSILIDKGLAFPLVSIWKKEDHEKWVGKSAMSMTLAAKEEKIEKEPSLIQSYINAHRLGVKYIRENDPAQVAKSLLSDKSTLANIGSIDEPTLTAILFKLKDGYGDGALDKAAYYVEMNLYNSASILEKVVPFEEAVETKFAGLAQ